MRRLILNLHSLAATAFAVLVLACVGCRHADLNRELVERELRLQEDELYRVHDLLAERERLLETMRRENEALKQDLSQGRATPGSVLPVVPRAPPANRSTPTESSPPQIEIAPPSIEIPGRNSAPPARSTNGPAARRSPHGVRPASHEEPIPVSAADVTKHTSDSHVAKIVLNRAMTSGFNADGRLGDEGVRVVIEPRDQQDRIVREAGKLSIVVVDPALSGPQGRVGRWDINPAECAQLFQKMPTGEGIQLELLWPGRAPAHERLILFARFTAADGESHEASQKILVDLARDVPEVDDSAAPASSRQQRPLRRQWSAER